MDDDPDAGASPAAPAPTLPRAAGATRSGAVGTGTVLAGRYALVRRIGSGGMGAVWEAEHLALGSKVAIKLIHVAHADDERARTRFLREAQAAAALRSPNVVQIFDYGLHDDTPYIAMELLEGESLSARLAARGHLDASEVLALVTQVGRAAARAHEAGVVHRDLKPDNIFLVPGEHGDVVKVVDFGIAKRASELLPGTTTGSGLLGTPFYMSPEQLLDATLADARADLWSLAVIAYESLLGKRPFDGATVPELAVAVLTEPAPVPSLHGAVPPGFDAWFERATRRDPESRFQGAAEMVDALADALRADPAPSMARAIVPTPRRSSVPLLAATVVGAVVLATLAFVSARGPEGDPPPAPAVPSATPTPDPEPPSPLRRPQVAAPAAAAAEPAVLTESSAPTSMTPAVRRPDGKPVRKPKRSQPAPLHDTSELEP